MQSIVLSTKCNPQEMHFGYSFSFSLTALESENKVVIKQFGATKNIVQVKQGTSMADKKVME